MSTNPRRTYFNELAARWEELPRPGNASAAVQRFVERAHDAHTRRILDVGCGTGVLLPALLVTHPAAECLVELDFAEEMLRENARRHRDSRLVRVCADACNLPFQDACFDLVACFGVLPHLGKAERAVHELRRVLRLGGSLSVGHPMSSAELNYFHRSLGEPVAQDTLPPAETLSAVLRATGLRVVDAEERPGWYFVRATTTPP